MSKIKIETTKFGEIEISADSIVNFPDGLIGFGKYHTFTIIDHKQPFSWLQSLDDPALAFLIIDSLALSTEYKLKRDLFEAALELKKKDKHVVLLLVALDMDPKNSTVNLRAPVVINLSSKTAVQLILDDESLSTQANLSQILKN